MGRCVIDPSRFAISVGSFYVYRRAKSPTEHPRWPSLEHATASRDSRRRLRRPQCCVDAAPCESSGYDRRSAQPSSVSAAALPGRDRRAVAREHRVPDSLDRQTQSQHRVLLEEVHAVDLGARCVTTPRGDIKYDFLILAAGAGQFLFRPPRMVAVRPRPEEPRGGHRRSAARILLSFEMAERENDAAARASVLLTFVVVGGGPTGVELAGAIAEISRQVIVSDFRRIDPREARVVLIEAGPRILPTFDESLAGESCGGAARARRRSYDRHVAAKAIAHDLIRLEQVRNSRPHDYLGGRRRSFAAGENAGRRTRSRRAGEGSQRSRRSRDIPRCSSSAISRRASMLKAARCRDLRRSRSSRAAAPPTTS